MSMTILEIERIASILGDLGQFMLGVFTIILAVYALISKRKDIFKSELAKSQFIEISNIRNQLSEIHFDVNYVKDFLGQFEYGDNIDNFKEKNPNEWKQYQRYQKNSLSLFNKFKTVDYYLFPKWIDKNLITDFYNEMQKMVPFTIDHTGMSSDVSGYQAQVLNLIQELDSALSKNC